MASLRVAALAPRLSQGICRQCGGTLTRRSIVPRNSLTSAYQQRAIRPAYASVRWHSAPASNSKVYDFEQVKKITESPSEDFILIGTWNSIYLVEISKY